MAFTTMADTIGAVAGMLTTVAFVPQVVKTLRTRRTRDISLVMWLVFCAGVSMWLAYGLLIEAWPIVIANVLTLMLAGTMLAVKLRNLRKDREECDVPSRPDGSED